jgi:DNA-binding transcriptional ArsR family regulator
MNQSDTLSRTFGALSDPTRRAILARLSKGELTVNEVAAPFSMTLGAVSKHLRVLEAAGLVARSRESQWRPCKLEAGPMREAVIWLSGYRDYWEVQFQRLDDVLEELKRDEARARSKTGKKPKGRSK